MRALIGILSLAIIAFGISLSLTQVPFSIPKTKIGGYYIENGREDTGSENIVAAVVVNYRGFDTIGEITVIFISAIGLGTVFATRKKKAKYVVEPASPILHTGCRFLFPFIILFGAYILIHGHLIPGGGFQAGAVIASAFLLIYLGCRGKRVSALWTNTIASLGAMAFVLLGIIGLAVGKGYFLSNFPPKGVLSSLFSASLEGLVFVIVGAALADIIDGLMEKSR